MLERLLSNDFEADQSKIDNLESEESDDGNVEIEDYFPEAVLSMKKK